MGLCSYEESALARTADTIIGHHTEKDVRKRDQTNKGKAKKRNSDEAKEKNENTTGERPRLMICAYNLKVEQHCTGTTSPRRKGRR
jgi:hypothetical protein